VIPRSRDRLLEHPGTFDICECTLCRVRYPDPRPVGETLAGYYAPNGALSYPDNELGDPHPLDPGLLWVLHEDHGYPRPGGMRPGRFARARARRRLRQHHERQRLPPWRGQGRLLDIGAGGGSYLATMRDCGWTVAGTTWSPEEAVALERKHGIPVRPGSVLEAGFEPGSFDVVTLWHVLEHVPDPGALLRHARALLAPGGLLGVGVPVHDCMEATDLGDAWLGYEVPRHLVVFDRAGLRSFVAGCGFQVLSLRSEFRDRVLKISYGRGAGPAWKRFVMRHRRLRRLYTRWLVHRDRIGTVVLWAERA
jgi:SAM-dependent methyltransferase